MPPLHPILVHFPIGVVLLSFAIELVAAITHHKEISRFGWWIQLAGLLTLAAAVGSGLLAARSESMTPMAGDTFATHEQLAFVTVSCMAVLVLWRAARRGAVPPEAPVGYMLLFALCVGVLLATGWFGGELVYAHGIGVHPP